MTNVICSIKPLLQLIARTEDRLAVLLTHLTFSSVQRARSTPSVPAEPLSLAEILHECRYLQKGVCWQDQDLLSNSEIDNTAGMNSLTHILCPRAAH